MKKFGSVVLEVSGGGGGGAALVMGGGGVCVGAGTRLASWELLLTRCGILWRGGGTEVGGRGRGSIRTVDRLFIKDRGLDMGRGASILYLDPAETL